MLGLHRLLLALLAVCTSLVDSQFTSSGNFLPAGYPLAVKAPYLNAWMSTPNGTFSLNQWPSHWDGSNVMGWSGYVRVDGVTWQWMGEGGPGNGTTLLSSEITPTSTKFSVIAGTVLLNLTFLSPIEPSDWVKQSLPFIYLSFEAVSIDGQSHDVQVYSDISAEWISGDRTQIATWQTTPTGTSVYHRAQLQSSQSMTEIDNQAEDSTVYYAMQTANQVPKMTYQTGRDIVVRGQFASQGVLTGQQDTNFRAINNDFVVLGFSVDLGNSTSFLTPVVWGLGLVRDPVIQYVGLDRSSYYWSAFSNIADAIDSFLSDFTNATQRANELDQQIMNAAQAVSPEYADLVAFGARQALASSDITLSKIAGGSYNLSDVKAFQRDTGFAQRVNAVERLFATMPIYLYLNASLLGIHLDSLLDFQMSGQNPYAAPDLGSDFPVASGPNSETSTTGVEDTGNMLIMTLAHARISGDGTLIKTYYDLLKTWADYLVNNTLYPSEQTSADGLVKPNTTNLAIKGIVGIAAMAEMSQAMGYTGDAQQYQANATSYVKLWESLATSSGHLLPSYQDSSSSDYALMYNIYADKLLQTNLISSSLYSSQASYYEDLAQSEGQFGLSYDSRSAGEVSSAWTLFTAGSMASVSSTIQNRFISVVHNRANYNQTPGYFPLLYDETSGNSSIGDGLASPGQGAMFAILALNVTNTTITIPAGSTAAGSSGNSHSSHISSGAIAGAVVGSVVGVACLCGLALFVRIKRRRQEQFSLEATPVPFRLSSPDNSHSFNSTPAERKAGVSNESEIPLRTDISSTRTGEGAGSVSVPTSPAGHSSGRSGSSRLRSATQLRNDVERLRQEMAELRAAGPFEPPPEYA